MITAAGMGSLQTQKIATGPCSRGKKMQICQGVWPRGLEPKRRKRCRLGGGWQVGGSLTEIRAGTDPSREGHSSFSFSFSLSTWNEALSPPPAPLSSLPPLGSCQNQVRIAPGWSSEVLPGRGRERSPGGQTSKAQGSQARKGAEWTPFQTGLLGYVPGGWALTTEVGACLWLCLCLPRPPCAAMESGVGDEEE